MLKLETGLNLTQELMSQTSAITPEQFSTFGELLKFLRRRAGLSQIELSIGVGYSVSQISRLETNERAPDAAAIAARFVPALDLEREREWVARLLELAAESHNEMVPQAQADAPQTVHHNLPSPLTLFVGRETELAQIAARLNNRDCRLLTLIGAGGIGKTRLALEAASQQLDLFRDGVYFVPLAPILTGQAELIAPAIADAVGFKFVGAREQLPQLLDYLRLKHMLLVLDNFEHVSEGRELVLEIIRHAPQIKVLVTSRAALNVQPEWLLHISGLGCPPPGAPSRDEILGSEAAQLFLERARHVNEHLTLNAETTLAISRICRSVEGMPLALELAAARARTLPLSEIAAQVNAGIGALETKMHDVQARHRSLRAVLDWSYELLSEREQTLFCSLSVFAGGWTLEAAVAVGANVVAANVPALLNDLVDQSLVVIEPEHEKARYRMLEPVRQYAETKLKERGEYETVRQRHLEYYLALAGPADPWDRWYELRTIIETELDNLRAATVWSRRSEIPSEIRIRLARALGFYLNMRGYAIEGRALLEGALAEPETPNDSLERAFATRLLADMLAVLNENATAEAQYLNSIRLFRRVGRFLEAAWSLGRLGNLARELGDAATARLHLEASLAVTREYQDREGIASDLVTLGEVFGLMEQTDRAKELIEEGMAISRSSGQDGIINLAWGYNHLGRVAQIEGDFVQARRLHQESLRLFHQCKMEGGFAQGNQSLGEIALAMGDATLATTHLINSLLISQKMGDRMGVAWCLAGLAGVSVLDEEPERAARLWGAAETLRQAIEARPAPAARVTHERLMAQARKQLGEKVFAAAWAEGSALGMEEAIAYAKQGQEMGLRKENSLDEL